MSWPPPKLHSCRWGWCCLNFDSNSDLVHHVVYDHVINSIPVRRRDVHMLRRAEEGIGSESLTLSGVMHIDTPDIDNAFDTIDGEFSFSLAKPHRSDHCFSLVLSIAQQRSPPLSPSSSNQVLPNPSRHCTRQSSRSPSHKSSEIPKNTFHTPRVKSFSSLSSSPASSSAIPSLPASPSFNDLISTSAHPKPSPHPPHANGLERVPFGTGTQTSPGSISSHEKVEQQLTQGMDVDLDADGETDDGCTQSDAGIVIRNALEMLHRTSQPPISLVAAPAPVLQRQRQTWYQAPSMRFNKTSQHSKRPRVPPIVESTLSADRDEDLGTLSPDNNKSAGNQISYALTSSRQGQVDAATPDKSSHSSQPRASDSQNLNFSFAYLQTQAPYRSQSLSQS